MNKILDNLNMCFAFLGFSDLAMDYDQKYLLCMLVSKSNVTLAEPLCSKNLLHGSYCRVISASNFMLENEM